MKRVVINYVVNWYLVTLPTFICETIYLILLTLLFIDFSKQMNTPKSKPGTSKKNSSNSVLAETVNSALHELNTELAKAPPQLDMYDFFAGTLAHSIRASNLSPSVYLQLQIQLFGDVQNASNMWVSREFFNVISYIYGSSAY